MLKTSKTTTTTETEKANREKRAAKKTLAKKPAVHTAETAAKELGIVFGEKANGVAYFDHAPKGDEAPKGSVIRKVVTVNGIKFPAPVYKVTYKDAPTAAPVAKKQAAEKAGKQSNGRTRMPDETLLDLWKTAHKADKELSPYAFCDSLRKKNHAVGNQRFLKLIGVK